VYVVVFRLSKSWHRLTQQNSQCLLYFCVHMYFVFAMIKMNNYYFVIWMGQTIVPIPNILR
jgi:hypothetical protein